MSSSASTLIQLQNTSSKQGVPSLLSGGTSSRNCTKDSRRMFGLILPLSTFDFWEKQALSPARAAGTPGWDRDLCSKCCKFRLQRRVLLGREQQALLPYASLMPSGNLPGLDPTWPLNDLIGNDVSASDCVG